MKLYVCRSFQRRSSSPLSTTFQTNALYKLLKVLPSELSSGVCVAAIYPVYSPTIWGFLWKLNIIFWYSDGFFSSASLCGFCLNGVNNPFAPLCDNVSSVAPQGMIKIGVSADEQSSQLLCHLRKWPIPPFKFVYIRHVMRLTIP